MMISFHAFSLIDSADAMLLPRATLILIRAP